MNLKTITNSVGLLLTIIGVYLVYKNSPINFDTIDGGDDTTDFKEISRITNKRNSLLRKGVYIVMLGSALQLVSNFMPQ